MPMNLANLAEIQRKIVRRFNSRNLFWEINPKVLLIIAGYTRSGTTFYSNLISYILKARSIHEPLNPDVVNEISFFHERESGGTIRTSAEHKKAICTVFGEGFRGNKHTNRGGLFFYRGRIIKIVRGNFYIDELSKMFPNTKFSVITRHPCACISSRIELGWDVPDHSKCITDIFPILTKGQRRIIDKADSLHKKLAVSWCLDNIMLLANQSNPSFKFLYYENLALNTTKEITRVLEFLGKDSQKYENRIDKEIYRQRRKISDPDTIIFKWKKKLNQSSVDDIMYIVDIFGLSYLYEKETAYPKHAFI